MKHLNFLSKLSSQSCGHSSVTLASTVGSPSAHRRGIMLKFISILVLIFTFGIGQMWGALSSPYECTFTASLTESNNQVTTGDVTWTLSRTVGKGSPTTTFGNQNSQSCIKFGSGKNNYYSKMTLTTSAFSSYNVSSVVVYISSNNGGSKTVKVTQGSTTIGTGSQSFSSTTWVTNCTRNTTAGSGGDLSVEISSDATATYVHSIKVTYSAPSCTVKPTVGASLTSVSADANSITATVPISNIGGCNITENGLVYSASVQTPTIGTTGCTKVTTTACGATAANKEVTIENLDCGTTYYVRGYAINAAGTQYTTNTTTQATSACPLYTVTLMDDSDTRTQATAGASVTLPERTGCTGYTFAGWTKSWNSAQTEWTTSAPTIIPAGSYTPAADENLYPVYTKTEAGSGADTYQRVSSTAAVTDGQYLIVCEGQSKAFNGGASNLDATPNFISVTISSNTITASETTTAAEFTVGTSGDNRTITSATGYTIGRTGTTNGFESSNTSTLTNTITISSNNAIITSSGGPKLQYLNSGNNSKFRYYASSQTAIQLYKRISSSVTSYISVPNCCTQLAQINGSVSWSNGEATVSFADLADVNGWGLKYKKSSEENWSTYAGGFADENGIRSNSTAISGLEAGSQYDFKVTGSYSGSTYCTGAFEAALSPSSSSYVPQMGDPSVPSITDLGYIVGAQTSDAQSFTISASRLIDNLTVTAPDNFQVSTTSGTTGFGSSATLTPTSGSLTNAEVWVRLATGLAENTYGGNSTYVTITGGGAAGKQVSVTGVVGSACHNPSISGSLSDATYNLNAEANALTITATKGDNSDPDLTYQWLQCTSSDGTYVNAVGGTGATTNSYTPPTTTAGSDLYYKCKVNSGTCFDYSGIARIQVNTPTITIGDNKTSHAFGDKGFGSENSVTISVSGANLAKDQNIGLALSGAGVSAYAIDKTSITASNGTVSATDVTITYTAAAGLSEATLTISSDGATSKTITLSGTGKYQVTYYANGDMEHPFATKLADGEGKLVLPDGNPTSCDDTYTTFIGWYSTAAGNNGSPTANISSCGTKAETTHSLTSNETYYAVFGDGGLSADEVKQVTLDFTDNTDWGFPTDYVNSTEENPYTNSYTVKLAGSGAASTGYKWNSSTSALIIGKKNAYLKLPAFSFATSKIVVTGPVSGASGKVTWNTFVGDDAVSTEVTGSNANHTFNIASANQAAGNVYAFKVTNDNNLQIKTIEVYSPGAGATAFISTCCTKHNVSISDGLVNGSVTSSLASACEGTSVTLTATPTPNAGRFNSWNITGLDSYSTTTNPLTFDMPDNDITVSATFDALYAITKVEEGGTITLGANYAAENDVVTISAVAKQDYEEPRVLKVYKTNDENTEITITNGQFTMPGYPVTAKVTYTLSKTPLPAPTMSANSNLTYNSVQLNWTNVANNSGYVLTVKQGEDVVEGYDAKTIDQDATSAVISGLEHLTAYTYTLYAKGDGVTYVAVNTAANGGFTTTDYPTVKIYYSENEVLRVAAGEDQKILTDFTLPNTANNGCTQKELVGWTTAANAEYSHASTAPTPLYAPGAEIQITEETTLYAVYAKVTAASTSWNRVTSMSTLTDGGTFIMGYEAEAKSGVIIPLRSADCDATINANGYFYTGTNASSSTNGTITMASVTETAAYEVYISSPTSGKINIQMGTSTGNYYGATSGGTTSNKARLYTEGNSTETNIVPEFSSEDNNQFKLKTEVSGDYKYLIYNTGSPRFAFYKNAGEKIVFYKKNVTPATTTNYATQCMAQVAKPVINGVTDGETYEEAKTITITSATNGATIYYTTDGTEPTTSSNAYSTPFEVSANGDYTIRAIAVKADMVNSDEATAVSFTLDLPFTTIASFIAAEPSTAKKLVFTESSNARVLAYNKNRIYIQDGTGAMFLYNTGSNNKGHGKTWASGKKIVGTLTGTYTTNNNMPRMTVTDFGATDVTDDAIELPTPIEVDALATNFASNVCKLVTISGVSIRSESVADNNTINMTKNDVTYNIYNAFNALTGHKLPLGTTSCTVTGILGQSNSGNTLQLMPISADGISTNGAEAVLPVLSVTGSTNSAEPFEVATNKEITFTPNSNFDAVYAINDGEEAAVTGSSNVTITDEENATKVYIKATREYYTTKEVSYYYRANSALIEYDITKSSMSHGSATIQNVQGDAITYAVGGATVTLVANPAEHYHWVSWEVTAGGEPVTVTNNTFEMPNAAVTVSATFEEDDYATVAFAKGNAGVTGDAPASQKVYVGENATMPGKGSMILSSHNFAGWKLGSNAVLNTGDTYTVTAADHEAGTITFEAQWEPYPWASAGKWELVTSASEITVNPTTYVIFADTLSSGNTACGLTQNDNNRATVSVTKTDNLLTWTGADPAIFIVEEGKDEGTFAFYDAINNNYIHAASSTNKQNYLRSNTDKNTDGAAWTINAIRPNGGATITADTYSHNLLNLNGNLCAAYTSPQKGLAIYKFVGGNYYNIVYAKGTEDEVRNMPENHVTDENGEAAIKENTPIRVGYTFTGWKDQDENVYTYNDGQIYAFTKNVTLTAQWEEQTDKYTVSYDANGSSDAVPAEAAYFENAEVTVAGAVSKEGFVFIGWECNGRVYTAGSRFYMPAADMPMVAKYAHGATYDNMTKVSNVYSIESHDAPEGSEAVFTNSYTTAKQITNGNSMTLTLSGYTGYTIEGVKLSTGSNNTSGQGTLSITIGGVEVATDANADKWYNGVHHYGSNNGTDFENVLVSMNPKTVKYGEDIVITIAASESSLYCQSFTILYDLLPVEVEDAATIEARDLANGTEVTIHDGGTLNVNANKSLDNLIIEAGGEVSGASALTVNNLTINSEAGKSGQVMNENVTVNGDIYLEIKLDKSGTMDPHKYYCISAPFDVAALEWGNGTPMVFNVDYQLFIYDGDKRARTGNGWQRVGGTIEKNSAYFIGFDDENTNNQNIIRLKAANKAIPTATSIELEEHPATYGQDESEIAKNSNWNGLGNPRLNYVNLNKNVSVYEAEEERFDTYAEELANGFVVGTAFFVQGTGNLTFENEAHGAYRAPKRESEHYMYCVEIAQENASRYDNRLYVMASETASSSFEEGKDLPTLNSETSKYGALIWTKNYGMRLVIEETPMMNNKASYELGIFAPANGTYRIETPTVREDADLYLTYEGAIIWNLSMGAYEAELTKGQNEGYGLLLVQKMPMTPTGVDEVQSDKVQCTKVVIDEHVYILRGGQMYDVTGKMVK